MAAEPPTAGGWSTDEEEEGGLSALQALCDLSLGSSIGEKRQAEASPFVTPTKPPRGSQDPEVYSPLIGMITGSTKFVAGHQLRNLKAANA